MPSVSLPSSSPSVSSSTFVRWRTRRGPRLEEIKRLTAEILIPVHSYKHSFGFIVNWKVVLRQNLLQLGLSHCVIYWPLLIAHKTLQPDRILTAWLKGLGHLIKLLQFCVTVLSVTGTLALLAGPKTLLDHLHDLLVHLTADKIKRKR